MSLRVVVRSRIISRLSKNTGLCRRVYSSKSNSIDGAAPIISSQLILEDLAVVEPVVAENAKNRNSPLKFLYYGLVAALTGAASVGYVTYAYSSDEIEGKTKALQEAAVNYTVEDDASAFEKYQGLLYSAAMAVSAKAVGRYLDLRRLTEEQYQVFTGILTDPYSEKLLPDMDPEEIRAGILTLVLDLNETLVYTNWTRERGWRTFKRPGVDQFIAHMANHYEIVVYSDQMQYDVDRCCDRLEAFADKGHFIRRLSRGATKLHDGKQYRDLSKLNRDPSKIIYLSGHAFESCLQPENCVPIKPFKAEAGDTALVDLIPFLEFVGQNRPADIRATLASYERKDMAKEFLERSQEVQRRILEQRQQHLLYNNRR